MDASLLHAACALRGPTPLEHRLTDTVAQTTTGNALPAIGAAPAMADEPA